MQNVTQHFESNFTWRTLTWHSPGGGVLLRVFQVLGVYILFWRPGLWNPNPCSFRSLSLAFMKCFTIVLYRTKRYICMIASLAFFFVWRFLKMKTRVTRAYPISDPKGKPKTIFRPKHLKSNTVFWYSFLHASLQLTRSGTETLKTVDIAQVENYLTLSFPLCSAFAFAIAKTKFDFHEIP